MSDESPAPADRSNSSKGKLAEAMAKAQADIKVAVFDKMANYGPYASFKSVREASINALSKNGIAIFQPVHFDGTNYFLETLVVHSSGESLSSKIKLLLDRNNMQGLGSAVTYAKRYAWASIVGVVSDDDDDGATAVAPPATKPKQNSLPPAQPKPKTTTVVVRASDPAATAQVKISNRAPASEEMINTIHSYCMDRDINEGVINKLIVDGYGLRSGGVPIWVAEEIIDLVSKPDCNPAVVMAEVIRVQRRRAEAAQKNSTHTGGEA